MANKITIDAVFCKGCRLCIDVCKKNVYELGDHRNAKGYLVPEAKRPEDCAGCFVCEMTCPDMVITVEVEKKEAKKNAA
jgi:2-oxoglutarate ferredoxin oxidoreductase subunit delta